MLAFPCKAFHDLIPTDGIRRPAGCPAAEEALAMDLAAENGEHDAARLWTGRGSRGGELVAGTSGISRLPHGRTGRRRRFAVPVRWRGAPLRRTPAGPRTGTRRPDGWTPGTGIGVVLTVPGVTRDPGGDDVRGCILMLAGAGRSTEDPGADEGAACQRGSSGPTHSRSYLAACPARTRMTMTSSSLITAAAWLPLLPIRRRVLPGSIHAGRARHTAVPQPGAPRGHRMLRQHPGARPGGCPRAGCVPSHNQ